MPSKCYIFEILFVCILLHIFQTATSSSEVLFTIKLPKDNQEVQYFTKEALKTIPAYRKSKREMVVFKTFDTYLRLTSDERQYEIYVIYKRTGCQKGQLNDSCLNPRYGGQRQYCRIKVFTKAAEPITSRCSSQMDLYFYDKIFVHRED